MDTYAGYGIRLGDSQSFSYGGSSYTITQPVVENRSAFQERDDLVISVARYPSTRKRKGRFVGVRQKGDKWVAEIRDPAKKIRLWLGSFKSAEEAAVAYDLEARRIRGAKANLNFPYGVPDVRLLLSARQTCFKTKRRHGKSWIDKAKEDEDKSKILSSRRDDESPQELQGPDDQGASYRKVAKSSACCREFNKDFLSDEEEEEDILKLILRLKEPDENFDMWNFEAQVSQE